MQASLPHVSVVIPTRERCDKLQHALSTCVNQNYDNLTILVSDNCSQDSTEEVVRETPDPRVKYVKTPCRVDMSTNWEFALSHVKGGLIIFVGDDDGLVPNCVEIATGLMRDFQSEAICWTPASYGWPCHPVPAYRNRLSSFQEPQLSMDRVATRLSGDTTSTTPMHHNFFLSTAEHLSPYAISAKFKRRQENPGFLILLSPIFILH